MRHSSRLIHLTSFIVFFVIASSILFVFQASGAPVSTDLASTVAGSFLNRPASGAAKIAKKAVVAVQEIRVDDETIAYVVETEPEGFVIISADTGIRPILGYSTVGKFSYEDSADNALLNMIKGDYSTHQKNVSTDDDNVKSYMASNEKSWSSYSSQSSGVAFLESTSKTWGPLIETNWSQSGVFDNYVPIDPGHKKRSYAGCVSIAASQIMNYWKFPQSISFTEEDSYVSSGYGSTINIPQDSAALRFPSFDELNSELEVIEYNGDATEKGYLSFAVGIKFETDYSSKGSGAYTPPEAYHELGYDSASVSNDWKKARNIVIENIKNGFPVNVIIENDDTSHMAIIDGYSEELDYFHINMGWNGQGNAWYSLPHVGEFNVVRGVVFDIVPSDPAVSSRLSYSLSNNATTDLDDNAAAVEIPEAFNLHQNSPNPFNPQTTITYSIPRSINVTLAIYNIQGQKVATLVNWIESAGDHAIVWDGTDENGSNVSSGTYFYKLSGPDFSANKKMLLVR